MFGCCAKIEKARETVNEVVDGCIKGCDQKCVIDNYEVEIHRTCRGNNLDGYYLDETYPTLSQFCTPRSTGYFRQDSRQLSYRSNRSWGRGATPKIKHLEGEKQLTPTLSERGSRYENKKGLREQSDESIHHQIVRWPSDQMSHKSGSAPIIPARYGSDGRYSLGSRSTVTPDTLEEPHSYSQSMKSVSYAQQSIPPVYH